MCRRCFTCPKSRPNNAGTVHLARARKRKLAHRDIHSAPTQRSQVCTRLKRQKDSQTKERRPLSCTATVPPPWSKPEETPTETPVLTEQLKLYKSWVTNERWKDLNKVARSAMRERKIFMMKGDEFPAVQQALLARGWIEKYEAHKIWEPPSNENPEKDIEICCVVERQILHKFVEHHSADFIWTTESSLQKSNWSLSNKEVIISRFRKSPFATKESLTASLTQMHWYTEPGVSLTRFPRCYNVTNSDGLGEFIEDFRITACISILKWLANTVEASGEHCLRLVTSNGTVPISAIEFALSRLNEYISFFTHKDIDGPNQFQHVCEHDWEQFLEHHYLLVLKKDTFVRDIYPMHTKIGRLTRMAVKVLAIIAKHRPQIDIDGVMNIWIVKPGASCRGRGIQLMNNIKDITDLIVNNPSAQKTKYVVQKYIENPLIIYNTKFDIRQWFLITSCEPLTVWIYKDSYLRFSSQIFSLSNYHESVHLTNNAVQSKYKNNRERDKALPDENMWDCNTFKAYLRQIGKHELWDSKIYPGIKQCLIGALLACQDSMHKRQNSFELYGADFMLTDDFTPWLIEINSNPDLEPTTSVTARLCPQCLTDVMKVVLDRRDNPEADTGAFELAYRQNIPKPSPYCGLSLRIEGKNLEDYKKSNKNTSTNLELVKIRLMRL